jgi:predicted PurR-regulated permease PerM
MSESIPGSNNSTNASKPSGTRFVVSALIFVGIVAVGIVSWKLSAVLLLCFGAVLLAIFLRAVAELTAKMTGLSYGWSLAISLVVLVLAMGVGLYVSGDPVAEQLTMLAEELPRSWEKTAEKIREYSWGERILEKLPHSTDDLPLEGEDVASYATDVVSSLTGILSTSLVILFLALYLAVDPATYWQGLIRLFPVSKRERLTEVLHDLHEALRWWLLGTLVSMLVVGCLTTLGLWLLGIPLPVALGVIAALLTFIPNIGPVLSALPALLLAFVESPTMAAYVAILYLSIQIVESYLITPMIQQRTVSLPPALTLVAQVALGLLLGATGLVLATPLLVVVIVLVTKLYIEDTLENRIAN